MYGIPILAVLVVLPARSITSLHGLIDAMRTVFTVYGGSVDRHGRGHADRRRPDPGMDLRGDLHLGAAGQRLGVDHRRRPGPGRGLPRRRRAPGARPHLVADGGAGPHGARLRRRRAGRPPGQPPRHAGRRPEVLHRRAHRRHRVHRPRLPADLPRLPGPAAPSPAPAPAVPGSGRPGGRHRHHRARHRLVADRRGLPAVARAWAPRTPTPPSRRASRGSGCSSRRSCWCPSCSSWPPVRRTGWRRVAGPPHRQRPAVPFRSADRPSGRKLDTSRSRIDTER